jgi:hypothetical protein
MRNVAPPWQYGDDALGREFGDRDNCGRHQQVRVPLGPYEPPGVFQFLIRRSA